MLDLIKLRLSLAWSVFMSRVNSRTQDFVSLTDDAGKKLINLRRGHHNHLGDCCTHFEEQ